MRIKNWREFQHYGDRNPPWIKLHNSLLSSKDWVALDDASRVLAVACMLIAAKSGTDGEFCGDAEYIRRVAYLNSEPDFKPLIRCGFIEDASNSLADDSKCLLRDRAETEQRQRREEESKKPPPFRKPSVEEVRGYIKEKKYNVDPELFIAHYESNGWLVGPNKMKNWKMAVVTWSKKKFASTQQSEGDAKNRELASLFPDDLPPLYAESGDPLYD